MSIYISFMKYTHQCSLKGISMLMLACSEGSIHLVKYFIDKEQFDMNQRVCNLTSGLQLVRILCNS